MKRTAAVLFFFLAIFVLVQPAYAYQCGTCQDSTGKFIGGLCLDGTPVPSCPPLNVENGPPRSQTVTVENNANTNTGSSTTVHIDTQSAPTHPPTIVTVVVTVTPTPTSAVAGYHTYRPVYYPVIHTPIPTLSPTATRSATKAPTPTKKPDMKPIQQKLNLFQSIAHFLQNIFAIFKKL